MKNKDFQESDYIDGFKIRKDFYNKTDSHPNTGFAFSRRDDSSKEFCMNLPLSDFPNVLENCKEFKRKRTISEDGEIPLQKEKFMFSKKVKYLEYQIEDSWAKLSSIWEEAKWHGSTHYIFFDVEYFNDERYQNLNFTPFNLQ